MALRYTQYSTATIHNLLTFKNGRERNKRMNCIIKCVPDESNVDVRSVEPTAMIYFHQFEYIYNFLPVIIFSKSSIYIRV